MNITEKLINLYKLGEVALKTNKKFTDSLQISGYQSQWENIIYFNLNGIRYTLSKVSNKKYKPDKVKNCIFTTDDFGEYLRSYSRKNHYSQFYWSNQIIDENGNVKNSVDLNKFFEINKFQFIKLIILYYLRISPFFHGSYKKSTAVTAKEVYSSVSIKFENIISEEISIDTFNEIEKEILNNKNISEENTLTQILDILNK